MNHTADNSNSSRFSSKFNRLAAVALAGALALAATTAHAGPFDAVRGKASAPRSAPAPAKAARQTVEDKFDELVQRAAETQATVNAVIAETDAIKARLAPMGEAFETVRQMKQRFQALDFDPAELLDGPELEDAMAMLKEQRRAVQARLNDPHVETFRGEFLETLGELRGLVAADLGLGGIDRTPLETLVENAPHTVMALIKSAADTGFGTLRSDVRLLSRDVDGLRSSNALRDFDSEAAFCAAYDAGAEEIYLAALRAKKRLVSVITAFKLIAVRIPSTPMRFGIHGYAELVQVDVGESSKEKIEQLVIALDGLGSRLDLVRETASHAKGLCSA